MKAMFNLGVLLAIFCLFCSGQVRAADLLWDANAGTAGQTDGAGTWLNANQWWTGAANATWNNSTPDNATIGNGGTGGTITLGAVTAGTVTFTNFSGTYTLSGGSLTNSGGITVNSGTVTISSLINGAGGISKAGSNTMIINNTGNAYTGKTLVTGGILQIGTGWSSSWASGTLPAGSNLEINGGTVSVYYYSSRSLGSGAGEIQLTGGRGGFSNKQGDAAGAIWTVNASAAYEVVWGALGEGAATGFFNPSTFVLNDGAASPAREVYIPNKFDLNGADRTIECSSATWGGRLTGIIRNSGGTPAGIIKVGIGPLQLEGANTYDGGTTLNAGKLNLGNNAAIGSGTLTINGGTLVGTTGIDLGSGNNNSILVNESFQITSASSATFNTGTGSFRISKPIAVTLQGNNNGSGLITIGNVIADTSGSNTLNALDVTWSCPGDFSWGKLSGDITLRDNQTLTVLAMTGQSTFTISGAIGDASNNYGLTVAGTTIVYLSATNTYTGTTTINLGGTLRLGSGGATGSLSPGSDIVNNGALQFNRNNTITQGTDFGVISGSGSVNLLRGTMVLTDTNTYSGNTTTPIDTAVTILIGSSSIGTVGSITSGPFGTGTLALGGSANSSATTTLSSDSTTARTILNPVTLSRYILYLGDATKNGKLTFEGSLTLNTDYTINVRSESVFNGVVSGAYGITKSDAGTLAFSGVNTYSGTTALNEGKLLWYVGGSCSNSAVKVSAGTLAVAVTNDTMQWTCGSLTHVSASILEFAFGDTVPSTNVAPLEVNGDIMFAVAPTVSCTGSSLPAGTYPLIKWTGAFSGVAPSSVTLSIGTGILVLDSANKTIWLNISGSGASQQPLTWKGPAGSTWVINEAVYTKWQDATPVNTNYQETTVSGIIVGDNVVFSNAPGGVVTLETNVSPASILVAGTSNYTFSGTGSISGSGGLTKSGTGTTTLSTTNSYSGGTLLSAGTISIGADNALGTGQLVLGNGVTIQSSNATARTLNNAVVLNGSSTVGGTGNLTFTSNGAGALTANSQITVSSSSVNATFGTSLSGGYTLTKAGAGTMTLTGTNTYSGSTTVSAGTLVVDTGEINNASAMSVGGGGTLVITNGGRVVSGATSGFGYASSDNTIMVVGGSGVTSLWNLGNNQLETRGHGTLPANNRLLIDGAGYGGSAVVTNVNTLVWGQSSINCDIVLTNGARMFVNGEVRMGSMYYSTGYVTATNNTITIVGGTADSMYYGASMPFYVGYGDRPGAAYNRVIVGSGGVLTNVGYNSSTRAMDFVLGQAVATQSPNPPTHDNQLVVTDGGKAFLLGNLTVGYSSAATVSSSNALLIDNCGLVNVPDALNVGYANNTAATGSYNNVTITNGGQLFTGANSYVGCANGDTRQANNNTAWIGGACNGTNALWNLGGANLTVGSATGTGSATGNVLTVNAGGVATNINALVVSSGAASGNSLVLSAGGRIHSTSATITNNNSLTIGVDDAVTPSCGYLAVSGNLNINNSTINIVTNGPATNVVYVIASYGTLTGSFGTTNGLPAGWVFSTDYQGNKIALVQPMPLAPAVVNSGSTNQGAGVCTLQGMLTTSGVANAWICWGTDDAGMVSTGNWQNVVSMGQVLQSNTFSTVASGLATNVTYWYRCFASNSYGTAWSDPATWFNAAPAGGGGSGYSMQITFTNFVGRGVLTNFPALVVLSGQPGVLSASLVNSGFELPEQSTWSYYTDSNDGQGGWSWTGGGGIAENGSPWFSVNAPEGDQGGFIQVINATMQQTFTVATAGCFNVTFQSIGRGSTYGPAPMTLTIDSTQLLAWTPGQASWTAYQSDPIYLSTGTHTVVFKNVNTSGDKSSVMDNVAINPYAGAGGIYGEYTFLRSDGYDLRFYDGSLTVKLNYEIESWTSNGASYVWVQVPAFSNNCSIWAKWGSEANTNQEVYTTNGATWSEGFAGVWHLNESVTDEQTSGIYVDSSTNKNSGAQYNTGTGTGMVSRCGVFDGNDYITIANESTFDFKDQITAELWLRVDGGWNTAWQMFLTKGSDQHWDMRRYSSSEQVEFILDNDNAGCSGPATNISNGQWHYFVGVYRQSPAASSSYINGHLYHTVASPDTDLTLNNEPLRISGRNSGGYNHRGLIDEVRVSRAYRSTNWIWACWMNQGGNHSSFVEYGTPVRGSSIANLAPTAITNNSAVLNAALSANGTEYDVWVHWGTTDQATNFSWASSAYVGSWTNVASTNVCYTNSSFAPDSRYYYTFRATNAVGNAWATPSWQFTTIKSGAGSVFLFW